MSFAAGEPVAVIVDSRPGRQVKYGTEVRIDSVYVSWLEQLHKPPSGPVRVYRQRQYVLAIVPRAAVPETLRSLAEGVLSPAIHVQVHGTPPGYDDGFPAGLHAGRNGR